MRLRTLPVSIAGVVMGSSLSSDAGQLKWLPAAICFLFAILAQIASNFANEYFDWRDGLDRSGREGPRRGVTEGDITPRAMLIAAISTLGVACCLGCWLIHWGGWLLLPVGIITAMGAMAYSAGPWPLSRHALGEVAVIVFFGIVPVNMVYYIMTGQFNVDVLLTSIAIGLMGAQILLVNNYRDYPDDRASGKNTFAVKYGRKLSLWLYWLNGLAATVLISFTVYAQVFPLVLYGVLTTSIWVAMHRREGSRLNPLLGMTAMNMLLFTILSALA